MEATGVKILYELSTLAQTIEGIRKAPVFLECNRDREVKAEGSFAVNLDEWHRVRDIGLIYNKILAMLPCLRWEYEDLLREYCEANKIPISSATLNELKQLHF